MGCHTLPQWLFEDFVQQIRQAITRPCDPRQTACFTAGPQGPPGEVSSQQLSDAIAGTSANTNAVELLAADADLPTVIAKINEMLTAQRR